MAYWLMKSEPEVFSIDDLKKVKREPWDGVRNYQARNFMREMTPGDKVLFYHSNCKPPGVAGLMTVASDAYPDPTQFERRSKYYDAKSNKDDPRWDLVDVAYEAHFAHFVSLDELRSLETKLADLPLLRRGNRLSIMPVSASAYKLICKLGQGR